MQKKIIALAIASAMTVPALAYADATVYGQARLSVDMFNEGAATNSTSSNRLVSNASRLGLKGSEDLGGGLSAIWQMEGTVGMDTGNTGTATSTSSYDAGPPIAVTTTTTNQFFDRNTFLGLKSGDMGTLVLGRYDTPYKISTRKLDVFIDTTAADNRGLNGVPMMGSLGGSATLDMRPGNSINYMSPSMSGFSVAAASVFGSEETQDGVDAAGTPVVTSPKKGSQLSLAGMYEQGPIYATLAYYSSKFGSKNTGDLKAASNNTTGCATSGATATCVDNEIKGFRLGGSYSMDAITVNAVIEQLKYTVPGATTSSAETKGTNLYLAGKFAISSTDAAKLAYTKRGETETTGGSLPGKGKNEAKQFAVGYDHAMSKTTTVYALYTKVTQQDFSATVTSDDPSTLSIGMNHSF